MPAAWIRILVVAALSVAALVGLVVHEGIALGAGTEIVMPMQPVDPQSLLSGHYVALDITEPLGAGQSCPPGAETGWQPSFDASMRKPRWVALGPGGGHTRVMGVADTRAAAQRFAPMTAHGDAYCVASVPDAAGSVSAWLGVDRFHLDQADAERIADAISPTSEHPIPVSAILSVAADGRTRVKGLMVGGRRIAPGWF
jgi:hypothetical protein